MRTLPALLAISSAATDLAIEKIPNLITVSAMLAGFLIRSAAGDTSIFFSFALMAAIFVFLFPFWMAGGIGAGDIKLLLAAACLLEPQRLIRCLLISVVFSGIMAAHVWMQKVYCRHTGKTFPGSGKIRMGIPIGLAIILSEVI